MVGYTYTVCSPPFGTMDGVQLDLRIYSDPTDWNSIRMPGFRSGQVTGHFWVLELRSMGLYYFDVQVGDEARSIDEEGEPFANLDLARASAGLMLCSLAREMTLSERPISDITINVRDELGEVMQVRMEFRMTRLN